MMSELSVREFCRDDAGPTARIFYDAIHQGAASHYSEKQLNAWVARVPKTDWWYNRLLPQTVLVAEYRNRVVGFMTLDEAAEEIDLAFVAPDFIGNGVAWRLYRDLIRIAAEKGFQSLRAHASYIARPFFERQGWSLITEQNLHVRGVTLTNFLMETNLDQALSLLEENGEKS